ncbi:MAG: radical SAM protein [Candidatus Omnitrophota bacterium]
MNNDQHILLIRAGYAQRKKIDHPLHCPPPLALKYAQALLEQNSHLGVRILDCLITPIPEKDILDIIAQWPVQTVCVEIASPASERGIALCKSIREKYNDLLIIAAGSDVSERYQFYSTANNIFDVILRGEFEIELSRLINRIQEGEKINIVKQHYAATLNQDVWLIPNLDELPFLNWTQEDLKSYPYRYPLRLSKKILPGYISTSRGCRHGCSFCSPSVRKSYGKKLRLRSAGGVIEEIERMQKLGVNIISFEDDDFTGNPEHARSICTELRKKRLNINWTCHARIDEVSPELLHDMKQAGCILILFGVESGSQRIIRLLHKSAAGSDWNSQAQETFRSARAAGIATCALFMVGNPRETLADVDESIGLAFQLQPDFIKVHNFTLYPGSQDYKHYGTTSKPSTAPHHYLQPIINVSRLTDRELKILQKKFYRQFFFRPAFLYNHIQHYSLFYVFNWTWSFRMIGELLCFLLSQERSRSGQTKPDKTVNTFI